MSTRKTTRKVTRTRKVMKVRVYAWGMYWMGVAMGLTVGLAVYAGAPPSLGGAKPSPPKMVRPSA
jgi:hypothetical protein